MINLNHVGHAYHSVSTTDIAMVIGGVVAAAVIAYVVVNMLKGFNSNKTTDR